MENPPDWNEMAMYLSHKKNEGELKLLIEKLSPQAQSRVKNFLVRKGVSVHPRSGATLVKVTVGSGIRKQYLSQSESGEAVHLYLNTVQSTLFEDVFSSAVAWVNENLQEESGELNTNEVELSWVWDEKSAKMAHHNILLKETRDHDKKITSRIMQEIRSPTGDRFEYNVYHSHPDYDKSEAMAYMVFRSLSEGIFYLRFRDPARVDLAAGNFTEVQSTHILKQCTTASDAKICFRALLYNGDTIALKFYEEINKSEGAGFDLRRQQGPHFAVQDMRAIIQGRGDKFFVEFADVLRRSILRREKNASKARPDPPIRKDADEVSTTATRKPLLEDAAVVNASSFAIVTRYYVYGRADDNLYTARKSPSGSSAGEFGKNVCRDELANSFQPENLMRGRALNVEFLAILFFLLDVSHGLYHLHRNSMVHLDIAMRNIFLERAVIGDNGISSRWEKFFDQIRSNSLSHTVKKSDSRTPTSRVEQRGERNSKVTKNSSGSLSEAAEDCVGGKEGSVISFHQTIQISLQGAKNSCEFDVAVPDFVVCSAAKGYVFLTYELILWIISHVFGTTNMGHVFVKSGQGMLLTRASSPWNLGHGYDALVDDLGQENPLSSPPINPLHFEVILHQYNDPSSKVVLNDHADLGVHDLFRKMQIPLTSVDNGFNINLQEISLQYDYNKLVSRAFWPHSAVVSDFGSCLKFNSSGLPVHDGNPNRAVFFPINETHQTKRTEQTSSANNPKPPANFGTPKLVEDYVAGVLEKNMSNPHEIVMRSNPDHFAFGVLIAQLIYARCDVHPRDLFKADTPTSFSGDRGGDEDEFDSIQEAFTTTLPWFFDDKAVRSAVDRLFSSFFPDQQLDRFAHSFQLLHRTLLECYMSLTGFETNVRSRSENVMHLLSCAVLEKFDESLAFIRRTAAPSSASSASSTSTAATAAFAAIHSASANTLSTSCSQSSFPLSPSSLNRCSNDDWRTVIAQLAALGRYELPQRAHHHNSVRRVASERVAQFVPSTCWQESTQLALDSLVSTRGRSRRLASVRPDSNPSAPVRQDISPVHNVAVVESFLHPHMGIFDEADYRNSASDASLDSVNHDDL